MKMHGPAELEMRVWIINDDTGQSGQATIGLGTFEYPTPEKVKDKVDGLIAELDSKGLDGFRVMTKREAFDAWSMDKFGEIVAMPGGPEWDEI